MKSIQRRLSLGLVSVLLIAGLVGGDEVRNQVLLLARFLGVLLEHALELVIAANARFHHLDVSASSAYWYKGGIEWRALSAWAVALVLGFCFTRVGSTGANWFAGPLADSWLGHNGLGWVVTFVVAGGLYALMGGAKDRRPASTGSANA